MQSLILLLAFPLWGQEPALRSWQAPQQYKLSAESSEGSRDAISASPLQLVAMQPCRLLDTRAGAPANQRLIAGPIPATTAVTVPVSTGSCGLPSSAAAYSFNITVDTTSTGPVAFLSAWPTGSQPAQLVSILNAPLGGFVANAAVVAAGTGGSIDLYASSAAHVIIDVNGYYTPAPGQGPVAVYRTEPINPAVILCPAVIRSYTFDFPIREIDTASAVTTGSNWVFTAPQAGYYHLSATLDQPMDVSTFSLVIDPIVGSLAPTRVLRTISRGSANISGPPMSISTAALLSAGERVHFSAVTGGCGGAGWVSIHYLRAP